MSTFTLAIHLLFDHFQYALIHGPKIPGSYAILLSTASDLASITSHIHNWVLFFLWLHPFILSGVISPDFVSFLVCQMPFSYLTFSLVTHSETWYQFPEVVVTHNLKTHRHPGKVNTQEISFSLHSMMFSIFLSFGWSKIWEIYTLLGPSIKW